MRAYTLSILTQLAESGNPIVEAEIITWVNSKLSEAKKSSSIRSFQDTSLHNALAVIDLVDAIKPGTINYDVIKMTGEEEVSCRGLGGREVIGSAKRDSSNQRLVLFLLQAFDLCMTSWYSIFIINLPTESFT